MIFLILNSPTYFFNLLQQFFQVGNLWRMDCWWNCTHRDY